MKFSSLNLLRLVGFLEGLSFIILVGICMPLKYHWGYEHATQEVGIIHGMLFVLYLICVIPVRVEYKWSNTVSLLVIVASFVPLGTFIAEYKVFRKYKKQ